MHYLRENSDDENEVDAGKDIETSLLDNSREKPTFDHIAARSSVCSVSSIDSIIFKRRVINFDHEHVRGWETGIFVTTMIIVGVVLGLFQLIEPYEKIEIYAVALLYGYLMLQFILLRLMCNEMTQFARAFSINLKYLLLIVLLLIVSLVVSMTVHLKYSSPIAASIFMALMWRLGVSLACIIIFCRIDSFFANYTHQIQLFIDHWDGWNPSERQQRLQPILQSNRVLTKVNKYSYVGFFLCVSTMVLFYTLLYYFDDNICHKINLILYCAFVFVTCSTYFLLGMCELTKLANQLPSQVKAHIKIKVKILHWEPSGDLMVGYAFGLLFKVFTNIVLAISGSCD